MSHKLLLADDSVTIQRVIELTFADEDVEVSAVGNGQQAIDRIAADPPDIVLADVGMPERDGYEVAAYVKSRPDLASIPVLLLTGAFEPVDEARAREARCDGVLAKPFEPQLLIARVKELLAGKGEVAPADPRPSAYPVEADSDTPPAPEDDGEERTIDTTELAETASDRPADSDVSLDDYFDRLDQAFATLAGGGGRDRAGRDAERPATATSLESVIAAAGTTSQAPAASPTLQSSATGSAAMQPVPIPVADVFATMLEAEASHPAGAPPAAPAVLVPAVAAEEMVEQITRRVLERLTDRALRDAVNEIVLATAERLVRDEIARTTKR